MKTSSENNFEQQWKQKFENASLIPPDSIWDNIEAGLDDKGKKSAFFLLWGLPAYVTSGIAATLILGLSGWFLLSNTEEQGIAQVTKTTEEATSTKVEQKSTEPTHSNRNSEEKIVKSSGHFPNEIINTVTAENKESSIFLAQSNRMNQESEFLSPVSEVVFENSAVQIENSLTFFENVSDQLRKLVPHQFEEYPVRYILSRNKLAYNEPIVEATTPKKQKRRSWIGLISGLSPFKPNFQSGSLNQLASANVESFSSNDANFTTQRGNQVSSGTVNPEAESAFVIPTTSPVQQFANGRAFNLGIQAGRQFTDRLAFESGVRYIQGNSPVNTNVYTLNERTGEINAFVQDYLTQEKSLANAVVAPAEVLNNSYEYLSIPLQLAYEIPLHKKVNVEITGGVSADMFLQNTLQSETTDVASLNSSNSAFRTVGISGLGGVRLNYLLDEKWELTVGSAFQQALVSNFESGTSAKLRPQMLGVNYGVNYHF